MELVNLEKKFQKTDTRDLESHKRVEQVEKSDEEVY